MNEPKKDEPEKSRPAQGTPGGSPGIAGSFPASIGNRIEKKLEEAEISLPPEERKQVGLVVEQVIETSEFFSGPQPSPISLEEYERVCPGAAEKLLQSGFAEQRHRQAWEMRTLDQKDRIIDLDHRDSTYAMTGLIFGFIALLAILGIGVFALATGHAEIAAGCLGGSFIAAVASVFVNGRTRRPFTTGDANAKADSGVQSRSLGTNRKNR
jgi:uncharacterized membrane protein